MVRTEIESGLNLAEIAPSQVGQYTLRKIEIIQPGLHIHFPEDLNIRSLFISRARQILMILHGPTNDEPIMQTLSYRHGPTEIQLCYKSNNSHNYIVKVNL